MKYLVVIEQTSTGYSAYAPDITGCVATGMTRDEVEQNMRDVIEFHLEGLRAEGYEVSQPSSSPEYVEIEPALLENDTFDTEHLRG